MEILNYTGRAIGLATKTGIPVKGIPSDGNAQCDVVLEEVNTEQRITVFKRVCSRVKGLPHQDPSMQKLYIVNEAVAQAIGHTRYDLLVPSDPMDVGGSIYYKQLINV